MLMHVQDWADYKTKCTGTKNGKQYFRQTATTALLLSNA